MRVEDGADYTTYSEVEGEFPEDAEQHQKVSDQILNTFFSEKLSNTSDVTLENCEVKKIILPEINEYSSLSKNRLGGSQVALTFAINPQPSETSARTLAEAISQDLIIPQGLKDVASQTIENIKLIEMALKQVQLEDRNYNIRELSELLGEQFSVQQLLRVFGDFTVRFEELQGLIEGNKFTLRINIVHKMIPPPESAENELKNYKMFIDNGFNTLSPLRIVGKDRSQNSYIFTLYDPEITTFLDERERFSPNKGIFKPFMQILGMMHSKGIFHGDPHFKNVAYKDINGKKIILLDFTRSGQMIVQVTKEQSEFKRILVEYLPTNNDEIPIENQRYIIESIKAYEKVIGDAIKELQNPQPGERPLTQGVNAPNLGIVLKSFLNTYRDLKIRFGGE